jgi:hypothetical protein
LSRQGLASGLGCEGAGGGTAVFFVGGLSRLMSSIHSWSVKLSCSSTMSAIACTGRVKPS